MFPNFANQTLKMMTTAFVKMKAMPATSLRLARCSLVTRGEEARKETIGGTCRGLNLLTITFVCVVWSAVYM